MYGQNTSRQDGETGEVIHTRALSSIENLKMLGAQVKTKKPRYGPPSRDALNLHRINTSQTIDTRNSPPLFARRVSLARFLPFAAVVLLVTVLYLFGDSLSKCVTCIV